jgi:hypothetical protein
LVEYKELLPKHGEDVDGTVTGFKLSMKWMGEGVFPGFLPVYF